MNYNVVEHFVSINGEGVKAGELAVFVRFKGCNLNCGYCDTKWANIPDAKSVSMSVKQIVDVVCQSGVDNVTLTGGEPLMQAGIEKVIAALLLNDKCVEIETNGSMDIEKIRHKVKSELDNNMKDKVLNYIYDEVADDMSRLSMTVDYKSCTSGMEEYMYLHNYEVLSEQDTVKFVVSNMNDLIKAKEIIDRYSLTESCNVYFSPVYGAIEPAQIVEYMKDNCINGARVQLQLHKYIWSPDTVGV